MSADDFSTRLRIIMRARGFTVRKLANRIGVSIYTANEWYYGRHLPRTDALWDIKNALRCSWDELLG